MTATSASADRRAVHGSNGPAVRAAFPYRRNGGGGHAWIHPRRLRPPRNAKSGIPMDFPCCEKLAVVTHDFAVY